MNPSVMTSGERIRHYRVKAGKTQAAVAGLVGRSEDWLSKVERGVISIDSLSMLIRIARELGLDNVADLVGGAVDISTTVSNQHPSVPEIKRALTTPPSLLGLSRSGGVLAPEDLAARVREAWEVYETETDRYGPVGEALPGLLADAYATSTAVSGDAERAAVRSLISLLHLHQVFLRRVGERALSLRAAERALVIADEVGEPALIAAASWNVSGILVSSGQVDEALDLARSVIAHTRPGPEAEPEHISAYGALHLVAVIAAVRASLAPTAWAMLAEARKIAKRIGEDRNDFHTAFGPTNVSMHSVHLAAEEGDASEALRLADEVEVPDNGVLPLERVTRYHLEVMHAHRRAGDDFGTLFMLRKIRDASPEEIRYSPLAREAAQTLVKRARPHMRREVHEIAQHVGVLT
ncbi:helix-turn-helix transcriptional regulator [Streptomyces sp. NPDC049906]|uniref:helix-turn-helix domain-containing protein n=1 Tax=Streptomyces sp. NPDC049906 TaxID=3155656 RepID=UPI00341CF225